MNLAPGANGMYQSTGSLIGGGPSWSHSTAPVTQQPGSYLQPGGDYGQYDPSNNYGNSGMSYDAYTKMYGTPQQQEGAASAAGAAANAAGTAQANNPAVNPYLSTGATSSGSGTPVPGVLSGPGYGEDWYAQHGNDINQPTNTQNLFDQGVGRTNSIYDNAIDMTNRQINAQTAARGIYDGSAALGSIGLADSNLRAAQVKDYEGLGEAADAANQGAYTAGSNAANAAQNETTNRISTIVGGQANLSKDQADVVSSFYDMAEKGQLTADMASIEAQIQASGVDAATAQALTNDILQAGGIVAKASSGGK